VLYEAQAPHFGIQPRRHGNPHDDYRRMSGLVQNGLYITQSGLMRESRNRISGEIEAGNMVSGDAALDLAIESRAVSVKLESVDEKL
jgi:hypothetical protein